MKVKVFTQYHLISIDPLPLFVNGKKGICSPLILREKARELSLLRGWLTWKTTPARSSLKSHKPEPLCPQAVGSGPGIVEHQRNKGSQNMKVDFVPEFSQIVSR